MGTKFGWRCNNCSYSVVMSGGKDCGMLGFTETFQCNTCHELMDVFVGWNERKIEKQETYYCKKCKGPLELWEAKKKPCPSCGCKLKIDKSFVMNWD